MRTRHRSTSTWPTCPRSWRATSTSMGSRSTRAWSSARTRTGRWWSRTSSSATTARPRTRASARRSTSIRTGTSSRRTRPSPRSTARRGRRESAASSTSSIRTRASTSSRARRTSRSARSRRAARAGPSGTSTTSSLPTSARNGCVSSSSSTIRSAERTRRSSSRCTAGWPPGCSSKDVSCSTRSRCSQRSRVGWPSGSTQPKIDNLSATTPKGHDMNKRLLPFLASILALAAVAAGAVGAPSSTSASCPTVTDGQLTIGTDNPAFPPWFGGGTKTSKWKINDPATGKGYESAVAYAIAKRLGFGKSQVKWTFVPFNKSFAPGSKSFDFDINQISITPARAKVVSFSRPYYDVNQAIVVNKGTKIAAVRGIKGLARYKLGAQLGTTSFAFIKNRIKPSQQPAVFNSNATAVLALKSKQIDGLVVDLPTAFFVTAVQVPNGKILGQFENKGKTTDHFGVVLAKGSPLTACVNRAITSLRANGTLKRVQQLWLAERAGAPILK